jgi:hypothetical protein
MFELAVAAYQALWYSDFLSRMLFMQKKKFAHSISEDFTTRSPYSPESFA